MISSGSMIPNSVERYLWTHSVELRKSYVP